MSSHIHFMGMGKMGLPMATHLKAAGHAISVSDPSAARQQIAYERGLSVADDLAAVSAELAAADFIFSSLPDDAALFEVAAQVVDTARRGTIFIDTSTVSPTASSQVADQCHEAGIEYLRCTVSGNNHMAEAAQLTVMASGPRLAYDAALPLLQTFGPHQFYLGDAEQARLMKLVVNLMIAQTSAMLAEGLTLGRAGGLDWRDMWAVLCASAVASPIVKAKGVQLAERDFTPTFTVPQMLKDLDLITAAAATHRVSLPQTTLTQSLMQTAIAQGDAALDYAAIIRAVERSAGLSTDLTTNLA
jgi:3-hydroxyisobutyrate dehydrogenase-like beta-hydroxyacid dehydrogenase